MSSPICTTFCSGWHTTLSRRPNCFAIGFPIAGAAGDGQAGQFVTRLPSVRVDHTSASALTYSGKPRHPGTACAPQRHYLLRHRRPLRHRTRDAGAASHKRAGPCLRERIHNSLRIL